MDRVKLGALNSSALRELAPKPILCESSLLRTVNKDVYPVIGETLIDGQRAAVVSEKPLNKMTVSELIALKKNVPQTSPGQPQTTSLDSQEIVSPIRLRCTSSRFPNAEIPEKRIRRNQRERNRLQKNNGSIKGLEKILYSDFAKSHCCFKLKEMNKDKETLINSKVDVLKYCSAYIKCLMETLDGADRDGEVSANTSNPSQSSSLYHESNNDLDGVLNKKTDGLAASDTTEDMRCSENSESSERMEFTVTDADGDAVVSAVTQTNDLFYSGYIPSSIQERRLQAAGSLDSGIGSEADELSQQPDLHTRSVSEEVFQGNACCAYQSTTSHPSALTTLSSHVVSEVPNILSHLNVMSTFYMDGGEAVLMHESTNKLSEINFSMVQGQICMYPELNEFNLAYQAILAKGK